MGELEDIEDENKEATKKPEENGEKAQPAGSDKKQEASTATSTTE